MNLRVGRNAPLLCRYIQLHTSAIPDNTSASAADVPELTTRISRGEDHEHEASKAGHRMRARNSRARRARWFDCDRQLGLHSACPCPARPEPARCGQPACMPEQAVKATVQPSVDVYRKPAPHRSKRAARGRYGCLVSSQPAALLTTPFSSQLQIVSRRINDDAPVCSRRN